MARIILSDILNDIRGSVQAHTFGIWKGVHYLRAKACTVGNPRTTMQSYRRVDLERDSRVWFGVLNATQRGLWEALAGKMGSASKDEGSQGAHAIIPKSRGKMSGFNAFISVNGVLRSLYLPPTEDAPLGIDAPPQPFEVIVSYVAGPPAKLTLSWNEVVGTPATAKIRVWGMSSKYCHKQLITRLASGVKTYDVTSMKGAGGSDIGIPSDYYSFQLDAVAEEGVRSAGSVIARVSVV